MSNTPQEQTSNTAAVDFLDKIAEQAVDLTKSVVSTIAPKLVSGATQLNDWSTTKNEESK